MTQSPMTLETLYKSQVMTVFLFCRLNNDNAKACENVKQNILIFAGYVQARKQTEKTGKERKEKIGHTYTRIYVKTINRQWWSYRGDGHRFQMKYKGNWLVPWFAKVDNDMQPFIVLCCEMVKDPFVDKAAVNAYQESLGTYRTRTVGVLGKRLHLVGLLVE